jgi:hypothetical protein
MSSSRRFSTVSGGENTFWQKKTGDNFTIELIPETGVNSVFIKKNLQVANEITVTSSEKEKEHITDIQNDIDDILKLNPKEYNYTNDSKIHYGLIAEEVEKIYPNLVSDHNELGKSLNYLEIVPLLILKIQDLQNQIDKLKRK